MTFNVKRTNSLFFALKFRDINNIFLFQSSETEAIDGSDYAKLFIIYIGSMVARLGAMSIFMRFLQQLGYGLTWKEVFILAYGGLKGAIGISIALIVA